MSGKRAAIGRFLKATSLTILTMACPAALSAQTPEPDYKPDHWPSIPQPAPSAPNILLIMIDDVGFASTSTFGGEVPTPTLSALAKDGARYNNFNTTGMCSPTRAALLTGRDPHDVEMGNINNLATGSVANSDTVSKIGLMYCQGQLR